jgi:hypothetical protein
MDHRAARGLSPSHAGVVESVKCPVFGERRESCGRREDRAVDRVAPFHRVRAVEGNVGRYGRPRRSTPPRARAASGVSRVWPSDGAIYRRSLSPAPSRPPSDDFPIEDPERERRRGFLEVLSPRDHHAGCVEVDRISLALESAENSAAGRPSSGRARDEGDRVTSIELGYPRTTRLEVQAPSHAGVVESVKCPVFGERRESRGRREDRDRGPVHRVRAVEGNAGRYGRARRSTPPRARAASGVSRVWPSDGATDRRSHVTGALAPTFG